MGRTRARLLAVGIVVLSMVGSALAIELWPQSPAPESNPSIPVGANGFVVFSVRNNEGSNLVIEGFAPANATPECAVQNAPAPLLGGGFPVTIVPGAQVQFVVSLISPYYTASGDKPCTFVVQLANVSPDPTVVVTYHVVATEDFDAQPTVVSFGSQAVNNFEVQTVVLTGFGSAQTVTVSLDSNPNGMFELVSCGGTASSCMVSLPGSGGSNSVQVRCNATTAGPVTGTLALHALIPTAGSGTLPVAPPAAGAVIDVVVGQITLMCTGTGGTISLSPDPLNITAEEGLLGSASIDVLGSGSAGNASITNYPQFSITGCGPSCSNTFTLASSLNIECTPGSSTAQATLTVDHLEGGFASATINCTPSNNGGMLYVAPGPLAFGSLGVGSMGSNSLRVDNLGGSTLTGVAIAFPAVNGEHYYADACTSSNPCSLGAGSGSDVTIWFAPAVHGALPSQLEVDAVQNGAAFVVDVTGTGLGGVMVVQAPTDQTTPPYHLEFGSIPIGQQNTGDITLFNAGNALYTATITGATGPYTVTPATDAVPESMSRTFVAACGSNAPSPSNDQTWMITSDAYSGSSRNITVSCAIADTRINVDPLMFDFGEVRVGSPTREITLTVSNPASNAGPALIKSMTLHEDTPGLQLVPATTTNLTLALGEQLTATLQLETGSDTDLTGQLIDIEVDNAMLALPVRGKVVTPHSRVVPSRLDLGTACVGTQVSGNIMLINDGTATLAVQRPTMSESFLAVTPGSLFPLELPGAMMVTAEISPAVSANGALGGTLTWEDDVPNVHVIPVILEYVSSGTALSPRALDFGIVPAETVGTTQRVTLENCDPDPTPITVKALRGLRGPIGAWILDPKVGYAKQLGAHEKQAVNVTFKPPARGRYEAELTVTTRSGTQTILLVGEATGRDFENTSFYTCECQTPGAPWGGWPLPAAMLVIIARRRRGSSSAR